MLLNVSQQVFQVEKLPFEITNYVQSATHNLNLLMGFDAVSNNKWLPKVLDKKRAHQVSLYIPLLLQMINMASYNAWHLANGKLYLSSPEGTIFVKYVTKVLWR